MKQAFDPGAAVERLINIERIPSQVLLYPGSFNPFHAGHQGLLEAAVEVSGRPGILELSLTNADKAPLESALIEERLAQIPSDMPVDNASGYVYRKSELLSALGSLWALIPPCGYWMRVTWRMWRVCLRNFGSSKAFRGCGTTTPRSLLLTE